METMKLKTKSKVRLLAFVLILSFIALLFSTINGFEDIQLNVAIIGDQTGTSDILQSYSIMEKGIQKLRNYHPDVAIHTGDMLESTMEPSQIQADYNLAANYLSELGVPWYLTAGDHDVNPTGYKPNSPDRSKEQLFQSLYSQKNPEIKNHLYYSFNVRSYHFISLYSLEHLHTDPRWGNVFLSEISDSQYNWLKTDLELNKYKTAIIVFLHQPMWYNWSGWSRIHNLLRKYSVVAVIAGHFHYNQNEGLIDGIRYLTVGATGATVKEAGQNAGGEQQVTLMTIKSKCAHFTSISVDGDNSIGLTARTDMDRIQALDVLLSNLWDFEYINTVYISGNTLTNSPTTPGPAKIILTKIGNPINVPVKLKIDFLPDSPLVILESSSFAKDAYDGSGAGQLTECNLLPSYRVSISNNSSVTTSDEYGALEPFWTGTLGLNGPTPPPAGTKIGLKISMSFTGSNGEEFTIYRMKYIVLQ